MIKKKRKSRRNSKKFIALVLLLAFMGQGFSLFLSTPNMMINANEGIGQDNDGTSETSSATSETTDTSVNGDSETTSTSQPQTTSTATELEVGDTKLQTYINEDASVNSMSDLTIGMVATNQIAISFSPVHGIYGYEVSRWMKSIHRFKTIIRLKANATSFSQKKLSSGSIYTYIITPYRYAVIQGKRTKVYGEGKKISVTTLTGAPKLSARKTKGQVMLYWNRVPKAEGYLIQFSKKKKKFHYLKLIYKGGTTTYTKKHLKKGKVYYYRVLSYRVVDGVRQYGPPSKCKRVKVQ